MLLNVIWAGFILVAIFTTLLQVVLFGATDLPAQMVKSLFDTSKTAFEIALGLTGVMTLWLGIMKVGERAGLIDLMARGLAEIEWDDLTESAPAVMTAFSMPFTFSIADGIAFGFISYVAIKALAGRFKDLSPAVVVIAALWLVKFAYFH